MSSAEFRRRRQRLMQMLGPGSVAIVSSARIALRNRDMHYPFRQNSDFYYLTGFTEPDAVLVLVPGRPHGEVILFCAERDPAHEQWHGERTGPERAVAWHGVDDAFPASDLPDILPGLLEGAVRVHVDLGDNADFDRELTGWIATVRRPEGPEVAALAPVLHELRLHKSPSEQKLLRRAADITAAAHCRAMSVAAPGLLEADLEAEIIHEFIRSGARHPAYPSIVGAGANACVFHYGANDGRLRDGDLVLVDAGCEYAYYASDVTRTFPVNGRFSPAQRALYAVVLEAQQRAIETVRPGVACNRPHEAATAVLVDGLRDLGLLRGSDDEIRATGAHARYCAPSTSHWLGLDVHDVGDYRIAAAWREFAPGMVLCIEPGIYVPDTPDVPDVYRGIGIRIEDAVLVTREGNEVLTVAAPKMLDDIEALMGASRPRTQRAARSSRTRRAADVR
jgi:Xaa-Pro aminopeptidase